MRLIILPTLALVACFAMAAEGQGGAGTELQVELDVFSGRPNPAWTLPRAQGAELDALIGQLPAMAAPDAPFDGLGYRGVVVRDPARPGWSLVAMGDVVRVASGDGSKAYSDIGASVERWLLDRAGEAVDPALLARLGY